MLALSGVLAACGGGAVATGDVEIASPVRTDTSASVAVDAADLNAPLLSTLRPMLAGVVLKTEEALTLDQLRLVSLPTQGRSADVWALTIEGMVNGQTVTTAKRPDPRFVVFERVGVREQKIWQSNFLLPIDQPLDAIRVSIPRDDVSEVFDISAEFATMCEPYPQQPYCQDVASPVIDGPGDDRVRR